MFFFFNDTPTTEIYTLSLHDALPISAGSSWKKTRPDFARRILKESSVFACRARRNAGSKTDRKSTRLNSSHMSISYAVFCLKKKKKTCKIIHHSILNLT